MAHLAAFQSLFLFHPWLWVAVAAAVGACIASFGGVLVDRLPHSAGWRIEPKEGVSLLTPSRCDACGGRVRLIPGLPVVGWLLMRGRCGECGARVPWRYPAIEAAVAALSMAWAWRFGPSAPGALGLCAIWAAVVLAWIDWREAWLPDRINAPLVVVGLLFSPFCTLPDERIRGLAMASGAIAACFLWLTWRRGENLFAGGDIMFCAAAGAWLGCHDVPAFLLIAGVLYGAHHAAMRLCGRTWQAPEEKMREVLGDAGVLPMGPALSAALILCLWLGPLLRIG